MPRRPYWWEWELELSLQLLERMAQRHFTETDLRGMLSNATSVSRDAVPGRWIARARWRAGRWDIIVEPDHEMRRVVVITAYPVRP